MPADNQKGTAPAEDAGNKTGEAVPDSAVTAGSTTSNAPVAVAPSPPSGISQIPILSQTASHDQTTRLLAYIVTAMFFLVLAAIIYEGRPMDKPGSVDATFQNLLFTLLGILGTGWANVIGYYFGSSAGSAQKSQTISNALMGQMNQSEQ